MKIEKRQTKNCLAICPICEDIYWSQFSNDKSWTLPEIKEHTKNFRLPKDTTVIEFTTILRSASPVSTSPVSTIMCLEHAKDLGKKLLKLIDG